MARYNQYEFFLHLRGVAEAPERSEYAYVVTDRKSVPIFLVAYNAQIFERDHFLVEDESKPVYILVLRQFPSEVDVLLLDWHRNDSSGKKQAHVCLPSELGFFMDGQWNKGHWWVTFRRGDQVMCFSNPEKYMPSGPLTGGKFLSENFTKELIGGVLSWNDAYSFKGFFQSHIVSCSLLESIKHLIKHALSR